MKRILVFGLKDPTGGVENAAMTYIRRFSPSAITADFAVFQENFSLTAEIESRGGRVFFLPDRIRSRAAYKKALETIFTETRYDAVWCHFSGLTNIDVLKYAKKYGVPKRVAHAHTTSLAWSGTLMRVLVPLFHAKNKARIGRYATDLWACSAKSGAFMYPAGSRVKLVPNAVETGLFTFSESDRERLRAEFSVGNEPVFGHVGRMCVAKNQRFLLEMFREVLRALPDAKLLFVGDGELHEEVHRTADELSLNDSVIFTGSRKDVPALLSAMDVFLLPSVTEGFPVTMVEAQVNGLPCVVSEEAVVKETDFTGGVRFVSLSKDKSEWAEKAVEAYRAGRTPDGPAAAREAGYDATAAAEALARFFCAD